MTSWDYRTIKVNLQAGKQRITLKSMGEGCNVDWFTLGNKAAIPPAPSTLLFHLFPIPVKDILNVDTDEENFEVTVFDMQGGCIYKNSNEKMIDSKNWPQGMYLLQLQTKSGKNQWSKIIKK